MKYSKKQIKKAKELAECWQISTEKVTDDDFSECYQGVLDNYSVGKKYKTRAEALDSAIAYREMAKKVANS